MLMRVRREAIFSVMTFVETHRRHNLRKCTLSVHTVAAVHVVIAVNADESSISEGTEKSTSGEKPHQ